MRLDELRGRFEIELELFLKDQRDFVLGLHPDLGPLVDEVVRLTLGGGKRLRPTFCYWGCRAGGGADSPELIKTALSLELLQTFALLHDDIMDGSRMRRSRPAAWMSLADMHNAEGWKGSPEHFGTAGAMLAGDLALMWSDQLLASGGFADDRVAAAFEVFTLMRVEVTAGQYLDILEAQRGHTSEAMARRICSLKSGLYTVERPLHIGLALAGRRFHSGAERDNDLFRAFTLYGNPLGQAFQIRDDILGVFGDEAATGKPSDDDLHEGKETVLVAKGRALSTPAERKRLDALLGSPDLDSAGVAELREILDRSGARDATQALVDTLVVEAVAALETIPLDGAVRDALTELAAFVAQRDR